MLIWSKISCFSPAVKSQGTYSFQLKSRLLVLFGSHWGSKAHGRSHPRRHSHAWRSPTLKMSHTIKHPLPIYVWIVEWTANVFKTENYLHPRRSTHSRWSTHPWRTSHPRHTWSPKGRHSHGRTHSWRHAHWTSRRHAHRRTHRSHARWASHAWGSSHAHGRWYCIARVLAQLATHKGSSGGVNQRLGLDLGLLEDNF